jgi:pimeloyl-ACP methyl ester carboxylesterase
MTKVQVNEIGIAYEDHGSGPPVILLHGYPFNRSLWREQVEALQATHRVITPDLRGHGESDVAPATMDQMARDVAALMTRLEIPKGAVGGLSMGGYVTLAFYRMFPERVQALILANTRASADTDEARAVRAQQSERALREGMEPIANEMLPKLLTAKTRAERPEIVSRVREMMLNTKTEGAAAALSAMAGRHDHIGLLSRIDVPTLIIVGREDPITPVKDSELMHREIRESRLEVIENAAHVSNLEQTKQFNQAVQTFLS